MTGCPTPRDHRAAVAFLVAGCGGSSSTSSNTGGGATIGSGGSGGTGGTGGGTGGGVGGTNPPPNSATALGGLANNWVWRNPLPQGNPLNAVAYSNGAASPICVAVGNAGTILTSPDGVTWTTRTSGTTNYLYGVAWGGTQFVAVGDSGTILASP